MKLRSLLWIWIVLVFIYTLSWEAGPGLSGENSPSGSKAPSLWVTPLVLDFGPVGVGDSSAQLTVTIANVGDDPLTNFAGGGLYPPFSVGQNCAGGVPPGGTCQYFFTFSPSEVGTFTATSNSSTNAGTFSIEVRGEGVGPRLHVSSSMLDFGRVLVGGNSPQQAVNIHNTGLSTLTNFAGGGLYPPFSASQNCAGGVPPGGVCQYFFGFSPTATGLFTATSNSSTNGGSFSIDMQGRGANFLGPAQRVTPRALNFGPVGVGSSGETLVVNVTNQSPFTTITDWAGGGVYPPFGASQDCAPSLDPLTTCQFFYTFDPTESGVFTTTSNVSNSMGSFTIELRGEGEGAGLSVSPLVLDFGYTDFGQTQVVTVKNTGAAELTNFAGGGVYPPFSAMQNCAPSLAPGATCQFFYEFNPVVFDVYTTTSNVSTNAGSFSVLLKGGVGAPSPAMSFLPAQISPGDTATLQYTLSNPNAGATLFSVNFNNILPEGMSVAAPLLYSASAECGAPNFAPSAGETSVLFWDATVLAGDECAIYVNVTAEDIGMYTNSVEVGSVYSGRGSASATLRVGSLIYLPLMVR